MSHPAIEEHRKSVALRLFNDLGWWWPLVVAAGVPAPRTAVVRTHLDLTRLLEGKAPLDGFPGFVKALDAAAHRVGGYPVFLRTGHMSGKHSWRDTCFVASRGDLGRHVAALVEESELADLVGFPVETWAVREFLDIGAEWTAFRGMPVGRERRYFVSRAAGVRCHHPYWPADAIEDHTDMADWGKRLVALNEEPAEEVERLTALCGLVRPFLLGAWSVDWLYVPKRDEWLLIDMAMASQSYHWPGCPREAGGNMPAQDPS